MLGTGLLFILVGSCEALLAAPRVGTRVPAPRMSIKQLSQPEGLHLTYEEFRYSVGRREPRPLGGDGSTAISTGSASATPITVQVIMLATGECQRRCALSRATLR